LIEKVDSIKYRNEPYENFVENRKFKRRKFMNVSQLANGCEENIIDWKPKFESALNGKIVPIIDLCCNYKARLVRLMEHECWKWWNCLDTRLLTEKVDVITTDEPTNEPYVEIIENRKFKRRKFTNQEDK
jgi:hypothetical protein